MIYQFFNFSKNALIPFLQSLLDLVDALTFAACSRPSSKVLFSISAKSCL